MPAHFNALQVRGGESILIEMPKSAGPETFCNPRIRAMLAHRRHRLWTHWVTLFALVLATLVPTVARTWAYALGEASADWGQICSAMETKGMTGSEPATGHPAGAMPEHCTMCLLRADLAGPPAMPMALVLRADLGHAQPTLLLQAPHTLYAWSAAQARAPPSLV